MNQLTLNQTTGRNYDLIWNDSINIGQAVIDVDGFYYFLPNHNGGGLWQAYVLRAIAERLDELNQEWSEEIDRMFAESPKFNDGELDDLPF
jgi:hypothetical protein